MSGAHETHSIADSKDGSDHQIKKKPNKKAIIQQMTDHIAEHSKSFIKNISSEHFQTMCGEFMKKLPGVVSV